jgi:hypothetical protein
MSDDDTVSCSRLRRRGIHCCSKRGEVLILSPFIYESITGSEELGVVELFSEISEAPAPFYWLAPSDCLTRSNHRSVVLVLVLVHSSPFVFLFHHNAPVLEPRVIC